jgi:thiamine pyrophosphokinase
VPHSKRKKAVILLGGDTSVTERLTAQCKDALVIAADSGIRHAKALGIGVDLWVGDFDSATQDVAEIYKDVPRQVFPADKDKSDGEIAINAALSRKAASFVLVGALGGERTDHALMIILQAMELARAGHDVLMSSGREEAVPLFAGTREFALKAGTRFSLVGLSSLEGVSIEGARWPLSERTIPCGSTLTLSNIATGTVKVTLRNGRALFISGSGG